MRSRLVLSVAVLALCCGGSQMESEFEFPPPPPAPPPPAAPAKKPARPPGVLLKSEVLAVVDAGFGRFLQRVDVEPALEGGRFRGWTIVALKPVEWWEGVDLKPGDVVTSVNGMPIERETEAFDAFQALKNAERLTVAYQRAKEPRTLEYKIVP